MKSINSIKTQEIVTNMLNDYNRRMNMINEILESTFDFPHTVFVKLLKNSKTYYNPVDKSITLIFVPNNRFYTYTVGSVKEYFEFDKDVYEELEQKDSIFQKDWDFQNSLVPLEIAIKKLLELPFMNIEVIKLDIK